MNSKYLYSVTALLVVGMVVLGYVFSQHFVVVPKGSSVAAASSAFTNATTTSSATSTASTTPPVQYQYKLLTNVDACALNTLGKNGWQPIQYGTQNDSAGNSSYIANGAGRDEDCQNQKVYQLFVWILFQRMTPVSTN